MYKFYLHCYANLLMGFKELKKNIFTICQNTDACQLQQSFKTLVNKTICIDISIYLHQYSTIDFRNPHNTNANAQISKSLIRLCKVLKKHEVRPIFVFDGKAPENKLKCIYERRQKRTESLIIKSQLLDTFKTCTDESAQQEIKKKLAVIDRQCTKIGKEQTELAKKIISNFAFRWMQSRYEADDLCAYLVNKKFAWACMSEDSDLFLHGCSKIMSSINLNKHTFVMYDTSNILKKLNMSQEEFRHVCWLTDASMYKIHTIFSLFNEYNNEKVKYKQTNAQFLDWLLLNNKIIEIEYGNVLKMQKDYWDNKESEETYYDTVVTK